MKHDTIKEGLTWQSIVNYLGYSYYGILSVARKPLCMLCKSFALCVRFAAWSEIRQFSTDEELLCGRKFPPTISTSGKSLKITVVRNIPSNTRYKTCRK